MEKVSLPVEYEIKNKTKVILSQEIAKVMNFDSKTRLSLKICKDQIIITKELNSCIFCDSISDLVMFSDKCVCIDCIERLKGVQLNTVYY